MYTGLKHTHTLIITVFLIVFIWKLILLMTNKNEKLDFVRSKKWIDMALGTLILVTGIGMIASNLSKGVAVPSFIYVKLALTLAIIPLGIVAFKKKNKAIGMLPLILMLYMVGVSYTKSLALTPADKVANAENTPTEEEKETMTTIELGGKLYTANCVVCHGDNGSLGASGAKDLATSTLGDEEVLEMIKKGGTGMQAFEGVVPAEDMPALVEYVKSLRK